MFLPVAALRVDTVLDSRNKGWFFTVYHCFNILSTQTYRYRKALKIFEVQSELVYSKCYLVEKVYSGAICFKERREECEPSLTLTMMVRAKFAGYVLTEALATVALALLFGFPMITSSWRVKAEAQSWNNK